MTFPGATALFKVQGSSLTADPSTVDEAKGVFLIDLTIPDFAASNAAGGALVYLWRSFMRNRASDEAPGWFEDRGQTVGNLFGGYIYKDAVEHAARMCGCEALVRK